MGINIARNATSIPVCSKCKRQLNSVFHARNEVFLLLIFPQYNETHKILQFSYCTRCLGRKLKYTPIDYICSYTLFSSLYGVIWSCLLSTFKYWAMKIFLLLNHNLNYYCVPLK
jgi:hypothetical protein